MKTIEIFQYLGVSFLVGALEFNLVVVLLFQSGLAFSARDQTGHFKKKIPLRGILTVSGFLVLVIGFIVLTNYIGLATRQINLQYWKLFYLNLALIISLILYDTLVIDWLVIGLWRPSFLKLPEAMDQQEMKAHMTKTLVAGPVFGSILALISTTISYFMWMLT